ncbi:MAG: PTS sugar transporter subunit IIC [Lachnospiraceae bacterium]|jgi:mannose/fructose/N-acetylgalactosamine-specific phosphotransferase system component IIC|nr:PTS sugar transporter subunit IIC [Lachnospiraceae bacterium]
MFLVQCILVSILAGLLRWDGRIFGQNLLHEPVVAGVLVGLIFGDPQSGLIMGATLQLVFLGIVGIGASTPPDALIGGVIGVVLSIKSGLGVEQVMALAMPMAILGQALGILSRVINAQFNHMAERYARAGDTKGCDRTMWYGAWVFFVLTAVPVFLGCYFGSDLVQSIIEYIPQFILDGLTRSSSLLPALGMALLMSFLFDKSTAPYLFLGFLLSAFMGLSTLGITILAVIIVYVQYLNKKSANA